MDLGFVFLTLFKSLFCYISLRRYIAPHFGFVSLHLYILYFVDLYAVYPRVFVYPHLYIQKYHKKSIILSIFVIFCCFLMILFLFSVILCSFCVFLLIFCDFVSRDVCFFPQKCAHCFSKCISFCFCYFPCVSLSFCLVIWRELCSFCCFCILPASWFF